jgi:multiple sugar transport system permease protein
MEMRRMIKRDRYTVLAFLLPAVLFVLIVVGYSIFDVFRNSFLDIDLARDIRAFIGIQNYVEILTDQYFWHSLRVTLVFTVASVSIEFFIGLGLALLLMEQIKGGNTFRSIFLMPMFIAPVVVGIFGKWMLNVEFGVINYFMEGVGLPRIEWLGRRRLALVSIVGIDIWQQTSMIFIILLAGLQSIPIELYEAATVDGASTWKKLTHITLPLLKPSIAVALILRTMFALRAFDMIFITTNGGPARATETISVLLYKSAFSLFRMGYASTLSVVMISIIILFSFIYFRVLAFQTTGE